MQYAIYTRGYSQGEGNDYKWSAQPDLPFQDFLGGKGVLIARCIDGTFTVYFSSALSTEVRDVVNRELKIAVLISSCTEAQAKGLALWALEHWEDFLSTFSSFVNNFGKDDWTVNETALKHWVNNVPEVTYSSKVFEKRLIVDNTSVNRKNLAGELRTCRFSDKAGFKIVIDNSLISGENLKTLREQVDRYLYHDAKYEELASVQTSTTPSKPPSVPASLISLVLLLVVAVCGSGWWYLHTRNQTLQAENRKLQDRLDSYPSLEIMQAEEKRLNEAIVNLTVQTTGLESEIAEQETAKEELLKIKTDLNSDINTAIKALLSKVMDRMEEHGEAAQRALKRSYEMLRNYFDPQTSPNLPVASPQPTSAVQQ